MSSSLTTRIHPQAIVEPGAEIGVGVEIGPYCIIAATAKIGDRCQILGGSQILGHTTLGPDNEIHGGAILGGTPQDRTYHGEDTRVVIGARNKIRENVTIHRATTKEERVTRIGDDNLIMGGTHIAHDCKLGNQITIGNNSLLAGHVLVEDGVTISGGTGIHHWCSIGRLAMIGALCRVAMDVPPFLVCEGRPGRVRGLNLVGLRRNGVDGAGLEAVRDAYKILFHTSETREAALLKLEASDPMTPEVQHLVRYLRRSDQGYRGRYLEGVYRGKVKPDADGDQEPQVF
ncbi:MAG: acyl-ACP--UDP-N-acetylglucosamine O-acyltransferase [Planctomycetes bacterium]|nr:acyl-ACP--UDP-N-acetylglucosamine O-acyltransferase [Planctomycetota bacterium]MCB9917254.1 acyl-ACP--UDP-N-acetylglucosamine O-acyltransferase [Planctomycetota bacterium]